MFSENTIRNGGSGGNQARSFSFNMAHPRKLIVGTILLIALIAFEIFNFDTTRYAMQSLLGDANFAGLKWATVLAIAFCAIDFAGLARLFSPEQGHNEPRAVYYLMGAWLLGATMNAMMTWWAVNLTLLNHDLGNEVLSRAELLRFVPLFVAVLVWLTRILFIGAFAIAGDHIFDLAGQSVSPTAHNRQSQQAPLDRRPFKPQPKSRIRQRTQVPGSGQPVPVGMQAQSHNR